MQTNIIIPIAGHARRFVEKGFDLPKPLLPVNGIPMIQLAIQSLLPTQSTDYKLIFVVREEHCVNHDIINALRYFFSGFATEFVTLDHDTKGTLCSCLEAKPFIDLEAPLIIYTPDICFHGKFDIQRDFIDTNLGGLLVTFKANSPDHSYVATDESGLATETAEKKVISGDAAIGVYCYRSGKIFLDYAEKTINNNITTNNEFYVAPMYNLLIADKLKIGIHRIDKMYVLGTPEDLDFYENFVAKYDTITRLAICCDHSGFKLKEALRRVLDAQRIQYSDFGAYSIADSDHYDFLKPCAEYLIHATQTLGIAFCHTGQGFNIAANKVRGLRSVLVSDVYTAEMGRRHNSANFFSIASRSVAEETLPDIVAAILNSSFDGGRHATRIQKFIRDPGFFAATWSFTK